MLQFRTYKLQIWKVCNPIPELHLAETRNSTMPLKKPPNPQRRILTKPKPGNLEVFARLQRQIVVNYCFWQLHEIKGTEGNYNNFFFVFIPQKRFRMGRVVCTFLFMSVRRLQEVMPTCLLQILLCQMKFKVLLFVQAQV